MDALTNKNYDVMESKIKGNIHVNR